MSDAVSPDTAWLEKLYEEGQIKTPPKRKRSAPPILYPDLLWIWQAFCVLSEQRGIGPNGPLPITLSDISAYTYLSGRQEQRYRSQLLRFIPPLDRLFLADFYTKQQAEIEKEKKKSGKSR